MEGRVKTPWADSSVCVHKDELASFVKRVCITILNLSKSKKYLCVLLYKWQMSRNLSILIILDVYECQEKGICLNNGTCVDTAGSYYCLCQNGWTGDHCEFSKFSSVLLQYYNYQQISLSAWQTSFTPLHWFSVQPFNTALRHKRTWITAIKMVCLK